MKDWTLAEVERAAILCMWGRLGYDAVAAAKALGIGKTTIYRKLNEYGVKRGVSGLECNEAEVQMEEIRLYLLRRQ